MNNEQLILVINLGSTSTKVALYNGEKELNCETIEHSTGELSELSCDSDQLDFRKNVVEDYLKKNNIKISQLSAIAARGGVIGEMESGAYQIDEKFVEACRKTLVPHVSNLTPIIAYELVAEVGIKAYTYDMVCGCGTPEEIFTFSGVPELKRVFLTHVLNSRAVCFEQARKAGKQIQDTTYIAVHMGGGITTNLIEGGRIKDIVADDEGTFSPERSGGVPCRQLVKLCFSGKYSEKEVQGMLKGKGGIVAYLGTNDFKEIKKEVSEGNKEAELICRAMSMQIAKDIGSLATVVEGRLDGIILTGGLAHSSLLTDDIVRRVSFIAPVSLIPGTFEMQALAFGILRVLNGQEEAHLYQKHN